MSKQTTTTLDRPGSDATSFALPAVADIRSAAEIHGRCLAALGATGDVRIDAGVVERIDAAVLQCLVALATGLVQGDRGFEVIEPSPAFIRAVGLLGLDEALGGPDVAST